MTKNIPDKSSPATVSELIRHASALLENDSAANRTDAEVLLAHVLGCDRTWLYAHGSDKVTVTDSHAFIGAINRRSDGHPVAHITGQQEFWSLEFKVTSAVLVPRPETELLVQLALDFLQNRKGASVLELGTGAGNISIALKKERPDLAITATDVSLEALEIARTNMARHRVKNIQLIESNWFDRVPVETYDLVVSNPPYIDTNDPHLESVGVRYEPRLALVGGKGGIDAIRLIAQKAQHFMSNESSIMIEHGYNQREPVAKLFSFYGYHNICCHKDLAGRDRVTSMAP